MFTKKQWKTPDEVHVKGMYRYKGRDNPSVFKGPENLKKIVYSSWDFSIVGRVGKLCHNEVLMVVDGPVIINTRVYCTGPGVSSELRTYAVKIMSGEALGWIKVEELDTVFEEITEDDVR